MSLHLYEDLLKAKSETEITLAAERVIGKLGFDNFLYALAYLDPNDGKLAFYTLGTYPKEWMDRYLEKDYVSVDPSIPHCQTRITPLIWESRLFDNPRAVQMNEEAKEFGINAGGCIPVQGNWLKGMGVFSISNGDDADKAHDHVAEIIGQFSLLASYVNQAVRDISLPSPMGFQQREELSPRELECLRWAALGFPAKLIADKMGISISTVNAQHLPEIRRKLGARTTCESVIIALQHGLIQP